jgi:hypothetical protein
MLRFWFGRRIEVQVALPGGAVGAAGQQALRVAADGGRDVPSGRMALDGLVLLAA